jgi:hypothetical protein
MGGYPEDVSAFDCQGSANGKEVFDEFRHLIRAMRVQPVIAHTDAEPYRHPIQKCRYDERFPAKHEQGGNRAQMEEYQSDTRYPVNLSRASSRFHLDLPELMSLSSNLSGFRSFVCKSYVIV